MTNTQVVILTPGRCGSSLLARVMMELGVYMGHSTRPPDDANPLGYFEDSHSLSLNRAIIHGNEYPQIVRDTHPMVHAGMFAFIESRDMRFKVWGFKNGETALTAHVWHSQLSNPRYIVATRDREEVAHSFGRAWGIDVELARQNFDIYMHAIDEFLSDKKRPALRIDYNEFIANPRAMLPKIMIHVGIEQARFDDVLALVRPNMKHVTQETIAHEA